MQDLLTTFAIATELLIALYAIGAILKMVWSDPYTLPDFEPTESLAVTMTINDEAVSWQPITLEDLATVFDCSHRTEPVIAAKTMTPKPGMIIRLNDLDEAYETAYQKAVTLNIKGINRRWKLATIEKKIAEATAE